jgi:4-amino-4-deoxy-L-arabinose transferase-like glycosyltransferase
MYGLACADHMAWGYVDHPPGGILIAWLARHLFGVSPLGLRLLPAAAGAALVWLTARLAREMGGGAFAQGLAALAICLVPVYTVFDHWLMMNAFEPLIWAGFAWGLIRVAGRGDSRLWLALGALAGIGLETKYSIAFLMVGVLAGLALTARRPELRSPWPWAGVGVAALIALPNFLWQASHHFPFLELTRNISRSGRDVVRGPLAFLLDQAVIMGPTTAPLWLGGLGWLLVGRRRRPLAVLGWAFLFVLGAFIALKGKNYYVTPAYPVLFAAGAAGLEIVTEAHARRWLRWGYVTVAAAGGLVLLPLSAPLLPPEALVRYEGALGLAPPDFEHQRNGPLPQYFADEFGWEEMVREVARVYHALPPDEKARTAIFSNGWGEAAAVDFYGPRYGLPRAISGCGARADTRAGP